MKKTISLSAILALFTTVLAAPAATAATTPETQGTPSTTHCHPIGAPGRLLYFQDAHEFGPVKRADVQRGSIAKLATIINNNRLNDATNVIFGGDMVGGTLFGGMYRGEPFVKAFNMLSIDVANFGQHEFDFGAEHTRKIVNQSNFTWIASNLVGPDGSPFVPHTSLIKQVGGIKIGYLGLVAGMATTAAGDSVRETDIIQSAQKAAKKLKTEGAELIVAVAQIPEADAEKVLAAAPEIGLVLREESSSKALDRVYQVPATNPDAPSPRYILEPQGDYGNVYRIDLQQTTCGMKVTPTSVKVDENVADDPQLLQLQQQYLSQMDTQLAEVVTSSSKDLSRPEMGQIIAKSYAQYMGTQIGWQNGGGVRAEVASGQVTLRNIRSVLPFDNKLASVSVSGKDLLVALEQGANSNPAGGRGYPRVSGLPFAYNPDAPEGSRITNVKLNDGSLIDPTKQYTVALTTYVLRGGDKVTAFQNGTVLRKTADADVEALIAYAKSVSDLATGSPRVHSPVIPTSEATSETPAIPRAESEPIVTPSASPSPKAGNTNTEDGFHRSTSNLARTGSDAIALLGVAVVIALCGAGALELRRRNRK